MELQQLLTLTWAQLPTGKLEISYGSPLAKPIMDLIIMSFHANYRSATLTGAVTSISVAPDGKGFLAATNQSNRYYLTFDFGVELRGTCHYAKINSIIFPHNW